MLEADTCNCSSYIHYDLLIRLRLRQSMIAETQIQLVLQRGSEGTAEAQNAVQAQSMTWLLCCAEVLA